MGTLQNAITFKMCIKVGMFRNAIAFKIYIYMGWL